VQSLHSSASDRVSAAFLALLLGYGFVFAPVYGVWKDHWLVRDGQEGMAVVTKEHWAGHGVVVYQYRVGQNVYTGQDRRSLQNPKYAHVMPGEQSVVYFSSSHPWLSAINPPRTVMIEGLPVVLLAWLLEAGLLVTVINPNSGWAFRFSGRREPVPVKEAGDSLNADIARAARPLSDTGGWVEDKLRLVGYGLLVVLGMAAIEIAINALFGRR
jgi:hypothetical protein